MQPSIFFPNIFDLWLTESMYAEPRYGEVTVYSKSIVSTISPAVPDFTKLNSCFIRPICTLVIGLSKLNQNTDIL